MKNTLCLKIFILLNLCLTTVFANKSDFSFSGDFVVLYRHDNPQLELRNLPECRYYAPIWKSIVKTKNVKIEQNKSQGGDGIDESMSASMEGKTFNYFSAGERFEYVSKVSYCINDTVYWEYPQKSIGVLKVKSYPIDNGIISFDIKFTPLKEGYYSLIYTGAPGKGTQDIANIFQPLVWQKQRFPKDSYLSLAFSCSLPATFIESDGTTWGVVASPDEFPFEPLPTRYNSRFGVLLRGLKENTLSPMIAAPVLGGVESFREKGETYKFCFYTYVQNEGITKTYKNVAQKIYGFKDYRRNEICNLNYTIDNISKYILSDYSCFIDSLRGCSYSTDVPGSVKNVSALHPFEIAIISDDKEMYESRALPITEFMLSRENSLFCLDKKQKIQNPSRKMTGPCATINEMSMVGYMTGNTNSFLLDLCKRKREKMQTKSWSDDLDLFRYTNDKKYLESAVSGAIKYINEELPLENKKLDKQFFWTSYTPKYISLLELYEETKNKIFLDAAYKGACEYAMYIWMCPAIPKSKVFVNENGKAPHYWYLKSKGIPQQEAKEEYVDAWRLSEIGLLAESSTTSIGHRAVFMAHHAPYMYRIAHYTGDTFLKDIARSAVVGRYCNFPGYHINTKRTTAYEKVDFPLRPWDELSVSSFHYNHPMPMVSMLYDFLITDFWHKSDEKIFFPSVYAEGYAYLQTKIYGVKKGSFYKYDNVSLWIPNGLVKGADKELNYLSAMDENNFYIAFSNQSNENIGSRISFDTNRVEIFNNNSYTYEEYKNGKYIRTGILRDGFLDINVEPHGLTAYVIKNVKKNLEFQNVFSEKSEKKWNTYYEGKIGGLRAMVLDFGKNLKNLYIYLQDDDSTIEKVCLNMKKDNMELNEIDNNFPYEFSFPIEQSMNKINFEMVIHRKNGKVERESVQLEK